ncbi:MAG: CRISPR-associated helicase Cas3' [bacterium]|nr:CRISPR-associated helicase Cas3' [bacterium]
MDIWAKSSGVLLIKHTEDVIKTIEKLPLDKLNYGNFKNGSNIDEYYLKYLLKWAGFFHDLGKISPSFQKKIGNTNTLTSNNKFPYVRHNILSLFFIDKEKVKTICRNSESLYTTFLSAVAFHHWKIDEKKYLLQINNDLRETAEFLLKNSNGATLTEELKKIFSNFKIDGLAVTDYISFDEHIVKQISQGGNLTSIGIIPPYTLYFLPERLKLEIELKIDLNLWIFLSGFLIRADHFTSFVERQEHRGITLCEVEKETKRISIIENILEKHFGKQFWQKDMVENFKNKNLILIAPTGIGKTEFALLWSEDEKLFYTLPLRCATNQIFDRISKYLNQSNAAIFKEEDPFINENVGLLHSDADLYLVEKSSNSTEDIDGELLKILDLSRHFSLPINICTGDQIFPASLKYPQYEKVYATLGYSRLVIDEVQAYNPKACAMIVKLIEDIVSLGGKFLLMTATLPNFVKNYLKDKNVISDSDIINYYSEIKDDLIRHKIELRDKSITDDIREIIDKSKKGKRVLVVCNTVEKAEEMYEYIKNSTKDQKIYLDILHSRFTLEERKEKEKRLEEEFNNPKPEDENKSKILVATQVIEASLDIDADYLFTEIAPMDSLIQRMGRIMRRVNVLTGSIKDSNRIFTYENYYSQNEKNIYVYYIKEKGYIESGKGKIYEEILLKGTLEILKNKNNFTEKEKQKLVEGLYDNLENSEYINTFFQTVSILNAGYVSEYKEEAHNLFREIFSMSIIKSEHENEIIKKINDAILNNLDITWLWFKKEIIAKYVINLSGWKIKEREIIDTLWNILKDKIVQKDVEISRKLRSYSENIWVLKVNKIKEQSIII